MNRTLSKARVALAAALVATSCSLAAAQVGVPDAERVIKLTVRPAPEPLPAFKYRLLPAVHELEPGNAAPLYLNGLLLLADADKVQVNGETRELDQVLDRLAEAPLASLANSDEASVVLNHFDGATRFFELAARRTRAGWENTLRDEGFAALLPSLNHMRMASRIMLAQSRVRLARGDVDGAFRKVRTTMALAHSLDEDPVIVQSLVGTAIAESALKALEEIQQAKDAPNFYWALADLPRPLMDAGRALQWERSAIRFSIPALRGREDADLSSEDWQAVARDFPSIMRTLGTRRPPAINEQLGQIATAIFTFPRAKAFLLENGLTPVQVDAMPAGEVLGRWMIGTYERWSDELAKWARLPVWQTAEGAKRSERLIEDARRNAGDDTVLQMIPSLRRYQVTLAAADRHVAMLQTVEALRGYAVTHAGHLPKSLADLTDLPAPLDPMTGQPFQYTLASDATATLYSPPPPDNPKRDAVRIEITITR